MRTPRRARRIALAMWLVSVCAASCGSNAAQPTSGPSPTPSPSPAPSATGTLAAVVRDDAGAPVAGASVTALVGVSPFARVTTAADGTFQLSALTLGATVILRITVIPFEDTQAQFVVAPTNTVAITVHQLAQATLSGTVQDVETGAPIAGATVLFSNSPGAMVNAGRTATTGPDGRYTFDHVYVGNAVLFVDAAGY